MTTLRVTVQNVLQRMSKGSQNSVIDLLEAMEGGLLSGKQGLAK
jgi:hypothetical protein